MNTWIRLTSTIIQESDICTQSSFMAAAVHMDEKLQARTEVTLIATWPPLNSQSVLNNIDRVLRGLPLTASKSSGVSLLALIWSQLSVATAAQVWLSARTNTSALIAPNVLQQSSASKAENNQNHPASAVRWAVGFWERCVFILASESCVGPKSVCALGNPVYVAIQGRCMLAQMTTCHCTMQVVPAIIFASAAALKAQVISWCSLKGWRGNSHNCNNIVQSVVRSGPVAPTKLQLFF